MCSESYLKSRYQPEAIIIFLMSTTAITQYNSLTATSPGGPISSYSFHQNASVSKQPTAILSSEAGIQGRIEQKRIMELTNTQLAALNAKLPPGYKIESITAKPSKSVNSNQRRSEAESLDAEIQLAPRLPEKRATREKRPSSFDELDSRSKQNEGYRKIYKIFKTLKQHPLAGPFLHPVDANQVPDYYQIIKDPIDLSTIEQKLVNGEFDNAYQFAADVRKMWNNSFYYNAAGSELYQITMQLSALFEQLMKGSEGVIINDRKDAIQDLYKKIEKMSKEIRELSATRAPVPTNPKVPGKAQVEKPMGIHEKRQLGQNIRKLDPKYLKGVLDIVKECMAIQGEELEFDIDKLPAKVCRELERYVKQCLQNSTRTKKKKSSAVNINGIMSAHEVNTKRLKELDNQLEEIAKKTRGDNVMHQPPPAPQESLSESDTSSSSESEDEEDVPAAPESMEQGYSLDHDSMQTGFSVSNMWTSFQQRLQPAEDEFTAGGFGSMMDLDKHSDMFH